MSGGFAQRAHDALGNRQLHIALDRTTAQLGMRRSAAVASLDNFDGVRDQARAAKMQVLRNEFAAAEASGRSTGEMTEWVRSMDRPLLDSRSYLKD